MSRSTQLTAGPSDVSAACDALLNATMTDLPRQVWMFQRFTVVMEYEQKPVLPPPFIVISHAYMLVKYVLRKLRGQRSETYDNGLKLFLEADDLERLHDFGKLRSEADCNVKPCTPTFEL